jgi:predicted nucleic acid-binding protein
MRIFLDANILFSAVKSDGAVHAFVAMLLDVGHECWVDGYVVDEARRNIMSKAPARLPHLDGLVSRLRMSVVAPAAARAEVDGLPEKDRLVLAAAVALECDALVTGDRAHFGKFYGRLLAGVMIHSPRSLYDHLFPHP